MYIHFESTLRHLADGLLTEANRETHGLYLAFDLRVHTDEKNYDQRDVAIGVHILRFQGRVLIKFDNDFLGGPIDITGDWESCSTHDSCWANSVDCDINRVIRDVINKSSKFLDKYKDDDLTFDGKWNVNLMMQTCNLVHADKIKNLVYKNDQGKESYTQKLIDGMYRKFMIEKNILSKD